MTSPLGITMVLPTLVRAGMETVTARLALDLRERGHRVSIVCIESSGPLEPELQAAGVSVAVVPALGLATNLRAPALVSWLKADRPDVVHTHSGAWLKGARAARTAGVPAVVHTVHGLLDHEPWYSDFLKRRAAACSDAVVAVSEDLRSYLLSRTRLAAADVLTIPNGIDTRLFSPGPSTRAELVADSEGRFVIGCVARLSHVKNHELLLRAFHEAHRVHSDMLLVLVGDGPLRGDCEALARDLGIADSVRFEGDRQSIPKWYRCFDAFALASRSEGTSMSILEAMASGCPVVATDVGGNAALIGDTGLLVSSGDAPALAAALVSVRSSPETARRMSAASRQRVMELFSQRVMVDRYEALYRHLLAA
jgi:glycosyltransferase involved in cell wall biosynthesis